MQGTFYDLISRTLGFIGVIVALFSIPYLFAFPLEIEVQQTYDKVNLSIKIQDTLDKTNIEKKDPNVNLDSKPKTQDKSQTLENKLLKEQNLDEKKEQNPTFDTTTKPLASTNTTKLQKTLAPTQKQDPIPQTVKPKQVKNKALENKKKEPHKNASQPESTTQKVKPTVKPQNSKAQAPDPQSLTPTAPQLTQNLAQENFVQLKNNLISKIKDQTNYPKAARRRGLEGVVLIEFRIENGKITNFKILKTSGRAILDKAASQTAKKLLGQKLADKGTFNINVPLVYRLVNN